MVSRRMRARFFSKAAPPGIFRLTRKNHKRPPRRYLVLIVLIMGGIYGWSFYGGQVMASLNPAIRTHFHLVNPTLDAWVTPPDYTNIAPIMVATPAGSRFSALPIEVPQGSVLSAHLADEGGDAPDLFINGDKIAFTIDKHGDFEIAQPIKSGDEIAIRRGWEEIGYWRIRIMPDRPPKIAFDGAPIITGHKAVRLAYTASDDYGITSIMARITPETTAPRIDNMAVDVTLASPDSKKVKRVSFQDLTTYPWSGQPVSIQLMATDAAGHQSISDPVKLSVPEHIFINPVARALIEEREKLIRSPDDESIRGEVANVMAGVAHNPEVYRNDQMVLITLRTGAVRLVLNHDPGVTAPVDDLLWQAAIRIEGGPTGLAEAKLRETQKELADALDHPTSTAEIQRLVEQLKVSMGDYLSAFAQRQATEGYGAAPIDAATLAPRDMDNMLKNIKELSASGSIESAREELLKLEQQFEDIGSTATFSDELHRRADDPTHPGLSGAVQRLMQNF